MLRSSILYTALLLGVNGAHAGAVDWEAARAAGLTKLAPLEQPVPVPDTAFVDAEGVQKQLADWHGQVLLVNFWATWCAPCRFEMPSFERVYKNKKDAGFVIVGIATDRAGDGEVRRFLAERGISYPVAMATGEVERAFGGVNALPTSFLIGRDGTIRHQVRGIFAEPTLRMAVDRLLAEPPTLQGDS